MSLNIPTAPLCPITNAINELTRLGLFKENTAIHRHIVLSILGIQEPTEPCKLVDVKTYSLAVLSKGAALKDRILREHNMILKSERGNYRLLNANEHLEVSDDFYRKGIRNFRQANQVLTHINDNHLTADEILMKQTRINRNTTAIKNTTKLLKGA